MSSLSQREDYVHETLLEERLRILLERLAWSYVALWTLNPQTRVFEWKRGYFNQTLVDLPEGPETTPSSSSPSVWDAQLFYTTYKSSSFAPGTGAVGRANLEGKHIWLTGDAVCLNAFSLDQSQFLRCTKIQTMMCIPWVNSVLEIGTTKLVGESFLLMDQIQQILSNDLLEPDPFGHASRSSGPAESGVTMFLAQQCHQDAFHSEHPTNLALQQPSSNQRSGGFQFSLTDQGWVRSGNSPNLSLSSDIVMQESEMQPSSHVINKEKESLSLTLETTGASTSLQMPIGNNTSAPAANWRSEIDFRVSQQTVNQGHGFMVSQADQYRPWSGAAASSSVRNQRESPARPSVSPDQLQQRQHQIHATSPPNARFSPHDRASSSVRQLHSQLASTGTRNPNQRRRTTSCGDEYEIQRAISLFEAQEMQEQWRRQAHPELNPASELAASADATVAKTLRRSYSPAGRSPSPVQYNESTNLQFQVWKRDGTGSPDQPTVQIQSKPDPASSRPTHVKRSNNASLMNQVSKVAGPLLRRQSLQLSALEVLKEADSVYQKKAAEDVSNGTYNSKMVHQMREHPRPSQVQMNYAGANLRGGRRTVGLVEHPGPVHAGHEEATVNHMLAERRRRTKQKDNFTALRKLVPIISKADKASTLTDAITYLKYLQYQIRKMEASQEDMDQLCQSLETKCKTLEERNQELVEIISQDMKPSSSSVHLNHVKLHSMKSI